MKTAEDILKSKLNNTQWNYLHHVLHSGEVYKQILEGMEEYAQQQVKLFATPDVSVAVCDHVWRDMHRSGDVCCDKCGISKYDLQQTER